MESSKNSNQKKPEEVTAFTGWGLFIGVGIGLVIGLFTRQWLVWTATLGVVGWITGALIDRSRLK